MRYPPPLLIFLLTTLSSVGTRDKVPAKFVAEPRDLKVKTGGLATFVCQATGFPTPKLWWKKGDQRVGDSSLRERFHVYDEIPGFSILRIERVEVVDQGTVMCLLDSGTTDTMPSKPANLTVYKEGMVPAGYPQIHPTWNSSAQMTVDADSEVKLLCNATGNPPPEIMWFRDKFPIDFPGDQRFSIVNNPLRGTLQIQTTNETKQGNFQCVAQNIHGAEHSNPLTLFAKVRRESPRFTKYPPKDIYVNYGDKVNVTCQATGSPKPRVWWKNTESVDQMPDGKPEYGMTHLEIANIYKTSNYTCTAQNMIGSMDLFIIIHVKTKPVPPHGIVVSETTPVSVSLTWQHVALLEVEYFTVSCRPRGAVQPYTEYSSIPGHQYTVRGLTPYTEYEFVVSGTNDLGRGAQSQPVYAFTGDTDPRNAPKNVDIRPLSATTIVIQWEEPSMGSDPVSAYKVYYTDKPELPLSSWRSVTVDSGLLTTIGNLIPNVVYTVRVQAFTYNGPGPLSAPAQIKTQLGVPSQPVNLRATKISESSITLEWQRPNYLGDSVVGYDMFWNDTYTKREPHHRRIPITENYIISDLHPSTKYRIWMSARSQRGDGAPTPPIEVETKKFVPIAPPLEINGEALNPTAIRVVWKSPPENEQARDVSSYELYYMEANQKNKEPTAVTVTNGTSWLLNDLNRWTEYKIWVRAIVPAGNHPVSKPIIIRTEEDVPGPPTNVKAKALNSSSVFVEWEAPFMKERNGIIRRYHIHVQETNPMTATNINEPMRYEVEDAREFTITGLQPNTTYTLQVAALTRKGDGDRSTPIIVSTPGGVPGKPFLSVSTGYDNESALCADLQWKNPTQTYGEVLGYRVRYGFKNADLMAVGTNKTDLRIRNLDHGAEYEFRVSARNYAGFGQEAIWYEETKTTAPTSPPTNVVHTFLAQDVVKFKWEPPESSHRNGRIIAFEVTFYKKFDKPNAIRETLSAYQWFKYGLEEGLDYVFTVRAATKKGVGPEHAIVFTTPPKMIRAPENVKAMATSEQSIEVWWSPIVDSHPVYSYFVFYTLAELKDLDACEMKIIKNTESAELVNLARGSMYNIAVVANTTIGRGRISETIRVVLEPTDVPSNLIAKEVSTHTCILYWTRPKRLNPIAYEISFDAHKEYYDSGGVFISEPVPRRFYRIDQSQENFTVDNLTPFTTYVMNVSAVAQDGMYRPPARILVTTQLAAPLPMLKPDFYGVVEGKYLEVVLPKASEEFGTVVHYYVLMQPVYGEDWQLPDPDLYRIDDVIQNSMVINNDVYITAKYPLRTLPYSMLIGMGEDINGFINRKLSPNITYRVCVRAVVDVIKNLYTTSPFSDPINLSMHAAPPGRAHPPDFGGKIDKDKPKETDEEIPLIFMVLAPVLSIGVICAALLIAFYYKKNNTPEDQNNVIPPSVDVIDEIDEVDDVIDVVEPLIGEEINYNNNLGADPVQLWRSICPNPGMDAHPPILVSTFPEHVAELKKEEGKKFSIEYESIDPAKHFTWDHSTSIFNKAKNRYANVVAYDHSRVVLPEEYGIPGSDYINANFCDGYQKHNAYVATQGPIKSTIHDFWRMCWLVNTAAIVMITKCEERTRVKCQQYWPCSIGGQVRFGDIFVELNSACEYAHCVLRQFTIRLKEEPSRIIQHLQYTNWPDHGVPDHPAPFLQFMRRYHHICPKFGGPIVVHCSAGVGRTGCFIVIDSMIQRMRYENTLDIYGQVSVLRAQRIYVVQTEEQYIFIHDAILEYVICGNTEVHNDYIRSVFHRLSMINKEGVSLMKVEFDKLINVEIPENAYSTAELPVNMPKNRKFATLPLDKNRVCLEPLPGIEGSDYINASFVDGYRTQNAYIVTQGPTAETFMDFWRMLMEHNSLVVANLARPVEMGQEMYNVYWPEVCGEKKNYGFMLVEFTVERCVNLYTVREFVVTDLRDNASRLIRVLYFHLWPEDGIVNSILINDFLEFMEIVHEIHRTTIGIPFDSPITIHCSLGRGRTGVFIAAAILWERTLHEDYTDVFQTVRIMHVRRPKLIYNEDDYWLCYKCIMKYLCPDENVDP